MNEHDLVAYLFRTLLEEEFGTKTRMANELGLPYRTVQWLYQHLDTAKGASNGFQRLIWYCCNQDVELGVIFRRFKRERRVKDMIMGTKQEVGIKEGDNRECWEAGLDRVYDAFEQFVRTLCTGCKNNDATSVCALNRFADALTTKSIQSIYLIKEEAELGKDGIGILRWMLLEAFNKHFHGNHAAMAMALQLPEPSIHKALEIEQWRSSTEVFERLAAYCLSNGISLDDLMRRYSE